MPILLLLFLAFCVVSAPSADPTRKGISGIPAIDTLTTHEWDIPTAHDSRAWAMTLGAIFPGGGQYYTGHHVRGGFITGLQFYLLSEVQVNYPIRIDKHKLTAENARDRALIYADSLTQFGNLSSNAKTWRDSLSTQMSLLRSENDFMQEARGLRQSQLAWMAGLHLYSLMDTWGVMMHNQGRSNERRPFGKTLALAIALPGAGQIYNGEPGKAGMLYMSLIGSAVSFQARQQTVVWYRNRLATARIENNADEIAKMDEKLVFFRKKRNQYIWGPVLFYLYSIADAAVDAQLSDFDNPIHLVMGPEPETGDLRTELALTLPF
jgi:hypothetical protein